jgi:hypothetical protein
MSICCKSTAVRGPIGSKMMLRTFFARRSTGFAWCLKALPHHPPRPSVIHGPNPKICTRPGSGHRAVLNNPVRCCSAFAHTPTSPTSLDPRCSALGPEPEAPHNGQAIGSGQVAAQIHRIHHSNEHPVGGANIGRVRISVSAACAVLGSCCLSPPHA